MYKKYFYRILLSLVFFEFSNDLIAQQNNVWIFGDHAGIDFETGMAVPFYNSKIDMLEGTAVASDISGNVLFYTDGMSVWNRNNVVMPNGTGLGGNVSSTSTLIVQKPGDCTKYYIFTTEDHSNNGDLFYSVIDMCLKDGYGNVITSQKAVQLQSNVSEKLCVIPNSNGIDQWLITHELSNKKYKVYAITESGINAMPTTYIIGTSFAFDSQAGYLKANHEGSKLATGVFWTNICEVVNFNSTTGEVYGPATNYGPSLTTGSFGLWYGLEFSPNDEFLYATRAGFSGQYAELFQINLSSGVGALISSVQPPVDYYYGALRLAPDGKIYMARSGTNYLGVINNPNSAGTDCNFNDEGLLLSQNSSSLLGLPIEMITTTFDPSTLVSLGNDTTTCESLVFNLTGTCDISFLWQDGDTSSSYTVDNSGIYWVTASNQCGVATDTIHVFSGISGTITGATSICQGGNTILEAPAADSYFWNTGEITQSITVTPVSNTTYWVLISGGSCVDTLFIDIEVIPLPKSSFSFTEDTLCMDVPPFMLSGGVPPGGNYMGNGVINNYFFPLTAGVGLDTISYVYTDAFGCSVTSSIELFVDVCSGFDAIELNPTVSVTPTLATAEILISSNDRSPEIYEVLLLDILGRSMNSAKVCFLQTPVHAISVSRLPTGIYYVVVKGKVSSVTRVIKN
ncbi:MAG: hypothetical protein ABI729_09825 [Chitinophagales bacterium]